MTNTTLRPFTLNRLRVQLTAWYVATLVAIAASFAMLSLSLKSLPFGTAYAVWTGIGAAGAAVIGMALYGESADPARLACIILIVAGTVGLRFVSST